MTKTLRSQLLTVATAIAAISGALAMGVANAAVDNSAIAEARAQYERDRAFCQSPESTQDRRNCLHEAAAAYDEALWKARGRAESPRAAQEPKPDALSSGLEGTLGSGTGEPRADRY
jgi:hypothetical protein